MAAIPRADAMPSLRARRLPAREALFMNVLDRHVVRTFAFMIACTTALVLAWTTSIAHAQTLADTPPADTAPVETPPSTALPKPPVQLRPGEYLWMPQLAPKGPVVIVVSLPEQLAYVYRNGVRIAVSTVSTGKPGYETPTGVFTILQKSREHYSNLYDNAPMPFMQRLTWSGVALHAGKIPNYPASHGCVRLPYAFSEKLFSITQHGMTVVIADDRSHAPTVAYPGLFAPVDPATGAERAHAPPPIDAAYRWTPEAAPEGALTIVLSTRGRDIAILRNGIEIGYSIVSFSTAPAVGTQAYVLLEGNGEGTSPLVPDRPALRWMQLPMNAADRRAQKKANRQNASAPIQATTPKIDMARTDNAQVDAATVDPAAIDAAPIDTATINAAPVNAAPIDMIQAAARGEISVAPEFARLVYDVLTPGTTLVVTDEPLHARNTGEDMTVLRADRPPVATPSTTDAPPR
jgi:L,D-transpeptidase catalytic domain